jgi:hypothetical protein
MQPYAQTHIFGFIKAHAAATVTVVYYSGVVPSISSTEVQQHRDMQSVLGWVTALSDIPIQGKMLIAAVGPRWCRHREEMIYTYVYILRNEDSAINCIRNTG